MNTFLKILLCAIAVVLALKFLPLIFGGLLIGFVATLVLAGLLLGGLGVGLCLLLVPALVLLGIFAPLWIPVLAVIGLIALVRCCARA